MTNLTQLRRARELVRSYAATPSQEAAPQDEVTQDDQDQAQGLALAALGLMAEHGFDPEHPGLDELLGHLEDEEGERAYAEHDGMTLRPSRKNPKVRRWIRLNAARQVGHTLSRIAGASAVGGVGAAAGHLSGAVVDRRKAATHLANRALGSGISERGERYAKLGTAMGISIVHGLQLSERREHTLDPKDDLSALSARHYRVHHQPFVRSMAMRHSVSEGAVAHALAYHALAEHKRQRGGLKRGESMKNGKPHPLGNADLSDAQYHKNLSGRAKSAFIQGMIAHRG